MLASYACLKTLIPSMYNYKYEVITMHIYIPNDIVSRMLVVCLVSKAPFLF